LTLGTARNLKDVAEEFTRAGRLSSLIDVNVTTLIDRRNLCDMIINGTRTQFTSGSNSLFFSLDVVPGLGRSYDDSFVEQLSQTTSGCSMADILNLLCNSLIRVSNSTLVQ
jgi:hypothetical protein